MLSRTGEYALRAVLLLAARGTGVVVPAGEIAGALGVPRNYLGKTLQRLVRRGVLKSVRGPGGGFVLAREANSLPISAVVGEFDALESDSRCMLGDAACDAEHPCAAHARWTAWSMAMAGLLDGTTVGELIGEDAEVEAEALAGAGERAGTAGARAGVGTDRNEVRA